MTPEEATIKAAIEARLAVLRKMVADANRQADALRREADGCLVVALRAAGGIAELEALAGGIVEAPEKAPRPVPMRQPWLDDEMDEATAKVSLASGSAEVAG